MEVENVRFSSLLHHLLKVQHHYALFNLSLHHSLHTKGENNTLSLSKLFLHVLLDQEYNLFLPCGEVRNTGCFPSKDQITPHVEQQ